MAGPPAQSPGLLPGVGAVPVRVPAPTGPTPALPGPEAGAGGPGVLRDGGHRRGGHADPRLHSGSGGRRRRWRRGFFNANSAHPFENPSGLTNLIEI
ncbi:potassium-transporting ATPase subunit KdpA [Streptomyces sp. RGM 3693]|uniref:potassium-transporting ATPase subunit KdpA n=1 Tax=Streptomyces sp. RGM 3693 TaxID=3413284 RepID=UPI003D2B4391